MKLNYIEDVLMNMIEPNRAKQIIEGTIKGAKQVRKKNSEEKLYDLRMRTNFLSKRATI